MFCVCTHGTSEALHPEEVSSTHSGPHECRHMHVDTTQTHMSTWDELSRTAVPPPAIPSPGKMPLQYLQLFCISACLKCRRDKEIKEGNSLAVWWLGLHTFSASDVSSILGLGTKIPYALCYGQDK